MISLKITFFDPLGVQKHRIRSRKCTLSVQSDFSELVGVIKAEIWYNYSSYNRLNDFFTIFRKSLFDLLGAKNTEICSG